MTPVEPQIENHLRVIMYRWWLIVGAGLLAFVVVYVWQSSSDDVYRAEGTVQVRVPVELSDDGEITEFQARSYAEMAATPIRLTAAIEQAGLDIDVDDAETRVEISVLSTPGFIEVRAEGPSPDAAEELAGSVLASIIAQVELDASQGTDGPADEPARATITANLLAPAQSEPDPIAPRPLPVAVLASLVLAITAAEGAVLLWHLQGRLSLADPASQVRALTGVRAIDLTGSDPESLLPFVAGRLEQSPVVLVLQAGQVSSAEVAVQIERALSRLDHRVMTFDSGSARPEMRVSVDGDRMTARLDRVGGSNEYDPEVLHNMIDVVGAGITVISAMTSRHEAAFDMVREFPGAVLLVVDPRKTTKKTLIRQAAAIEGVGTTLQGVVLHREPRKPVPLDVADSR